MRSRREDLCDLRDRALELGVGVVEVRPEPDPGAGAEVAEDSALGELFVHRLEAGTWTVTVPPRRAGSRGERMSNPAVVGEARSAARFDASELRPDPLDADLLDQRVAGRRRVERGHVRRPGEEAGDAVGVAQLRLERER